MTDKEKSRGGLKLNAHSDLVFGVLQVLAVIIVISFLFRALFRRIGQAAVIAEILAGLFLGPSGLGKVAPTWFQALIPADALVSVQVIAQIGVMVYMFLIGTEVDLDGMRRMGKKTAFIAHSSILLPIVMGFFVARMFYGQLAPPGVPFLSFGFFLGVAMSVTALPVLVRIMDEIGSRSTELRAVTLGCAAVDDITAWCLLAFTVALADADLGRAVRTLVLAIVYMAVMIFIAAPALKIILSRFEQRETLSRECRAVVLFLLFLSALATELIGIHALIGAFLFGVVVPTQSRTAIQLRDNLLEFVESFFLPAYFAFTGLRVRIWDLQGSEDVLICAIFVAVACAGKFLGTYLAARFVGFKKADATEMGILMNTRGLMALIVLNIGLDIGIITPRLFAILVLVALLTTCMTMPLLKWFRSYPSTLKPSADQIESA